MPGHVCKAGNRTPRIIIIINQSTGRQEWRIASASRIGHHGAIQMLYYYYYYYKTGVNRKICFKNGAKQGRRQWKEAHTGE